MKLPKTNYTTCIQCGEIFFEDEEYRHVIHWKGKDYFVHKSCDNDDKEFTDESN